nr:MAG TPA: Structural protein [Crassvirales sp.]
MTAYYDDGYIYVQGNSDNNKLKYIWVKAIFEDLATDNDSEDVDEDDIKIPSWLIPPIKEYIFKNELSFMLNRPSDDSNNATLASVKPHGPQDEQE